MIFDVDGNGIDDAVESATNDVQTAIARAQARGCDAHACPSVIEVLNNPGVVDALAAVFRISNQAQVEMGFYITQGSSGRLYVQPTVVGERGQIPRDRMPALPDNAVAWVHTHPDEGRPGGVPGLGTQSGEDRALWRYNRVHDIILYSGGIYVRSYDDSWHFTIPWR